jgi:hypothetical protein
VGQGHGGGPDARHTAPPVDETPRRRRWPWLLLLLLLALGGWAGWLLVDATNARTELTEASALVTTLQDQVIAGDREGARQTLELLQAHSGAARGDTQGPHWSVAGVLPWVGPNVDAVRAVAEVIDELSTTTLPALMDATEVVDPAALAPVGGRVNIEALEAAAPTVVSADAAVQAGLERLDGVDSGGLWSQVATPLAQVREKLGGVALTTGTASRAVQLLPAMLGADGPRDYLLLVQNPAEVRATGGIPGSVILLRADDGVVQILDGRSGGSMGDVGSPVLPLTDAETALFGPNLAADMRDVTFTPDFPRSAEIARTIWMQQVGGEVDGVVSVDPGALALLLGDTGPVALPPGPVADAIGGQLTAQNAVATLTNTVYLQLEDPTAQDVFFAQTAGSVLNALLTSQGEPAAAVEALAEAARQGRLMVWSADKDEQALLTGTVLSGDLRGDDGDSPVIGVFFNDGSRAKMDYYLQTSVVAEELECLPDGSRQVGVTITLTNGAPVDVAALPAYVTGDGAVVPVGEVRTNVLVYAPTGGLVEDVQVVGEDPGVVSRIHDGLAAVGRTTQLTPGESVVIEARVSTGLRSVGPLVLRTTPMINAENSVTTLPQCS